MIDNKQIFDFALSQLKSAIDDLKSGKTPKSSKKLKKISNAFALAQQGKITQEEFTQIVSKILK